MHLLPRAVILPNDERSYAGPMASSKTNRDLPALAAVIRYAGSLSWEYLSDLRLQTYRNAAASAARIELAIPPAIQAGPRNSKSWPGTKMSV